MLYFGAVIAAKKISEQALSLKFRILDPFLLQIILVKPDLRRKVWKK